MWECEKCGEWRFSICKECHCKSFTVINEDGDEYKVQAMTEEDAALKYAEESNENRDYYLMNESVHIIVSGKAFSIRAEPDVNYSAEEL